MTSRAQTPLVIERSHSENSNFSALLCEQMSNEKERQTTKQKSQEHRSIAPLSLQLRSYKNRNRQMSEELISNDRRVEKELTPLGFEPLISPSITRCTDYCRYQALVIAMLQPTLY